MKKKSHICHYLYTDFPSSLTSNVSLICRQRLEMNVLNDLYPSTIIWTWSYMKGREDLLTVYLSVITEKQTGSNKKNRL